VTGTYYTALQVYSNGGNAYSIFTGSAATSPIALLEYSNGEGGWTTIPGCQDPIAGCTNEIDFAPSFGLTQQTIVLRLTNYGGSALTIAKSKPLEGTVLGATAPNTDFSGGLSIIPGTLTSHQVGPKTSTGNSPYKYLGCYLDFTNSVRIEPQETVNVNMTNGLCQTTAQAAGFIFAGTEYMTQCFSGSIIPSPSLLVADSYCSYSCGGDATQVCGGGYLSVFYDSSRYFPANGTVIGASGLGPQIPKTVGA
jgi:hypothetical protein